MIVAGSDMKQRQQWLPQTGVAQLTGYFQDCSCSLLRRMISRVDSASSEFL
jgi:hypothetical protein